MDERPEPARAIARVVSFPLIGLGLTYVLFALIPWGRQFDVLAAHGRWAAGWKIRRADLALLETISAASLALALIVLIVVAAARGRWRAGLGAATAVVGSLVTTEILKFVLPSQSAWTGEWRWLSMGAFPSGHSVIVASIALAGLSVSSDRWRRLLIGPLAAWVAVATTATVTMGWHRPSDVIGSLFLATAWHRGVTALHPAPRSLRSVIPAWARTVPSFSAIAWWGLAGVLVLGAAAGGILHGMELETWGSGPGRPPALAYFMGLGLIVLAAGVTVLAAQRPAVAHATAAPSAGGRATKAESVSRRAPAGTGTTTGHPRG